jgi:hypothetical protein
VWRRAVGVWALLAFAMVANGVARFVVLVPLLGERGGEVASGALGIALILVITRPFIRTLDFVDPRGLGEIAVLWVGLTVGFEFAFGHFVAGASWAALIANYDLLAGRTWPVVLAVVAASPFIWRPRHRSFARRSVESRA